MNSISEIGSLLKKIYRCYSQEVLSYLENKGFNDLRPSFLEILIYVSDSEGPTLKEVGDACRLKKQTMTSHVNELVKRGYLKKVKGIKDKRQQNIYFTDLGEKFRMTLKAATTKVDDDYRQKLGEIEILKIKKSLNEFYSRIS